MNRKFSIILLLLCLITAGNSVFSQERQFKIYFKFKSSIIDSSYKSNASELNRLKEFMNRELIRIDKIKISGYSAIDGHWEYNDSLAVKRAAALRGFFRWKYPETKNITITTDSKGENWEDFKTMILNDNNLPNRKRVLEILNLNIDKREKERMIRNLDDGKVFGYIEYNILRYLRYAVADISFSVNEDEEKIDDNNSPNKNEDSAKINKQDNSKESSQTINKGTLKEVAAVFNAADSAENTNNFNSKKKASTTSPVFLYQLNKGGKTSVFAVKTNLLFDAATALNVELEKSIGKRWSIAGEWIFPWWRPNSKYCLQILNANLEVKYWLGDRDRHEIMQGWFTGLYTGVGLYDLQAKKDGWQGEFFTAGIMAGYTHSIADNLSMEYTLGFGYMTTDYKEYYAKWGIDSKWHYLKEDKGNSSFFAPTRLKVSLVWTPDFLNKKGGHND